MSSDRGVIAVLQEMGQSIWLDWLPEAPARRTVLEALVEAREITGVTCNPTIVRDWIVSGAYDDQIRSSYRADRIDLSLESIFIPEVQALADTLACVFVERRGYDGYVSVEAAVSGCMSAPEIYDEAARLWSRVDRPNVLIKIPATRHAIEAIPRLLGSGVNLNVTLIFSRDVFESVAEAYLKGIEAAAAASSSVSSVFGVASVFVGRVDRAIEEELTRSSRVLECPDIAAVRGEGGVAIAAEIYGANRRMLSSPRWSRLSALGARPQRLLWASLDMKIPGRRDVEYVERLIGGETVSTVSLKTLRALQDHGVAKSTLQTELERSEGIVRRLSNYGIVPEVFSERLLHDGLVEFSAALSACYDYLRRVGGAH